MATAELGAGVLTGTVVTRDGWPVPHAVVTVLDLTGAQSGRTTVRHDGHFAVTGLGPGTYTVICECLWWCSWVGVLQAWCRQLGVTRP